MKNKFFKYALTVAICVFFVSCYEVNEEIEIKADGSGTYVTKMDMGQLIDLMQTFAGDEEIKKDGLDKVVDTTIYWKSLVDTAKDITPDQKELLKDGKMNLQMNLKEKLFKMDLNFPYKNLNNLQQLMSGKATGGQGLANAFKSMFGKGDEQTAPTPNGPDMSDFAAIFDVTVKNGSITKKVNEEKYKALMNRPEMGQLKQLSSSSMEILYTTTIKLPRPAKQPENTLLTLSEDKKTVTMKYNLLELLENPSKFAYSINY